MKHLVKLKILLDLNFQTFDNIVFSLKSKTNFLTRSLSQLNLQQFRNYSFPTFTKSILFMKSLIKNLEGGSLNISVMKIILKICEKLVEFSDPSLNFETLELMLEIIDKSSLESEDLGVLFQRMLESDYKLDRLLKLNLKWNSKAKFSKILGVLWRDRVKVLYVIIMHGTIGKFKMFIVLY